jgi:hypothetical protein
MKKVLVVYYTQSGQLLEILRSVMRPLEESGRVSVTYEELRPVPKFPFPWKPLEFFGVQPESVLEIPGELEPFRFDPQEDFDLIVLGYQIWFLSPSIPVNAFLCSAAAARCLRDKPVVTVIGCRNMWLMAHEQVKRRLRELSARLVMNLPYGDRAANLVSLVTIVAWMFSGKQDYFKSLPRAGVSRQDIDAAGRDGSVLLQYLLEGTEQQPATLFEQCPAEVDPRLIGVERAGRRVFTIWAKLLRSRGAPGDRSRTLWVRAFMVYLTLVLTLLFPLTYLVYRVQKLVNPKALQRKVAYFSGRSPD